MTSALEVVRTGAQMLLEDAGRPGLAAVGVGRSGAADRGAYRLACRLVGHRDDPAALEVLLGGLVVRARGRVLVAVTGAVGPLVVGGRPAPHAAVLELRDGAELALGAPTAGLRSYLAVRGGLDVPAALGSRSTDVLSGIGPAPVRPGDVLPVGPAPATFPHVDHAVVPPPAPGEVVLDVLPGPRASWVGGLASVTRGGWVVGPNSDRVGVRLRPVDAPVERLPEHAGDELPSEGMVRGAVQLPPGGEAVVFLADHPVTGGYPVVAVLTEASADRAAQLRPGQAVRLRAVTTPAR